jgi:RNA polymerase sigma factor (sigma-70 family)
MSKTVHQYTDSEFIMGLRTDNNEILNALYKKHYNVVLKFIINNSGTEDAARDIYQETILVVYENARKPSFTLTCRLQTYIYSIARRLWLTQLRINGRTYLFREEEGDEIAEVNEEISEHLAKEKDIEKMNVSMEALGEPCKELIKDFYVKRLSMDEIAEKFGYTNSDNAKTQKYKCLQRLKKYFFNKNTVEHYKN